MKKSVLLLLLCCLLGSFVYTQVWVTFTKTTPEPPIIDIIESNNQHVEFHVEVSGMYKTNITKRESCFKGLKYLVLAKLTKQADLNCHTSGS